MTDISTTVAGVRLESPTVLASGVLGLTASSALLVMRRGAGAATLKSCGMEPRPGHKCPTILPFAAGLINAVGLSNPGVEQMAEEIRSLRTLAAAPVFASVFGRSEAEFGEVTKRIADAAPDLIEVNVSCPNVQSEFGTPFGLDFVATQRITRLVKKGAGDIPISIKLSPNVQRIGTLARLCQEEGADAITAINTAGPGMVIDTGVMKPVLKNCVGGLSGPAILPIAVRCVYDIYKEVSIPIIGTGGVSCADDALQMIMAGATAVGIGTAVYQPGIGVFEQINHGLRTFLNDKGLSSLEQVKGAAHE